MTDTNEDSDLTARAVHAYDDITATFMSMFAEYEERTAKRRAADMARVRAGRAKAKAQTAAQTPNPEHGA